MWVEYQFVHCLNLWQASKASSNLFLVSVTVDLGDVLPTQNHLADPLARVYSLGPVGEHQTELS
jgi:hypothetical protein